MIFDSVVLIIMDFICLSVSQNTWIGDGSYWWRSTSDFKPMHSTAYGTLILRDALYMEFDIVFHGPTPTNWQNVFRVGFPSYSGDCANHNSRYPSLWMLPDFNKWHFSISEADNCGKQWGSQPPATIGFKYHVIIHYNTSNIFISLNNIIYIDTMRTQTMPELIDRTMYIYISTDETGTGSPIPAANVTMSNIIIVSYSYNESFTLPPTYAPTDIPTKYPTKYPTMLPTHPSLHPTTDPTIDPTHDPSSDPTYEPTLNPTLDPTGKPTVNPTSNPSKNPSNAPTNIPSTDPTRYPIQSPMNHPTTTPSLQPVLTPTTAIPTQQTWSSDYPIVTLSKLTDDRIDPVLALVVENLIYIGIALIACFAICCPILFIWCCCYMRLCPTDKEGDDADHSESDHQIKNEYDQELFVDQQEAAGERDGHQRDNSSGSSWAIPIKRVLHKEPQNDHNNVVPQPIFAGLIEGSGSNTDDFISDEEDHLVLQRERDREIRQQQIRLHQERFLGHNVTELYRVATQSPPSHLDNEIQDDLAMFRDNDNVDEDDEKRMYLGDLGRVFDNETKHLHDEGDMSTEPEFTGHGGMGVTSMNLEQALDDGLSIVPSSGQYERSEKNCSIATEPRPASNISQSTISNSYKPRKKGYRPPLTSSNSLGGSSGGHSTPTTIDEEKEIDEHYYQNVPIRHQRMDDGDKEKVVELKLDINAPPIRHITRKQILKYNDTEQHQKRKQKKQIMNRNGNPFIPRNELQKYHKRNTDKHYNDDTSSDDGEYTDEYYDEDSGKEDDIVQDLQMQMDRAQLSNDRSEY